MGYTTEDVEKRLSEFKQLPDVSDRNKELVEELVTHLQAEEVTKQRQRKAICLLENLLSRGGGKNRKYGLGEKFIDFDLDTATKAQMVKAMSKVGDTDYYSDWTRAGLKRIIRKLYYAKWESQIDRPDNVQRILDSGILSCSKIKEKRSFEAFLPQEIMAMVDKAETVRDRLLPLFYFECGARPGEFLEVTLNDVELNHRYADVTLPTFKNDKGNRTLAISRSYGLLQQWLEQHPRRDEKDAPLLVNIDSGYGACRGDPMTNANVSRILKELSKNAGIDKRTTPKIVGRHSAATYYGTEMDWSITKMLYWFGWSDPESAKPYCHEDKDRINKAKLAAEGLEVDRTVDTATDRRACSRCEESWPPTQKYCGHCSLALDTSTAEEVKQLQDSGKDVVEARLDGVTEEELLERVKNLEEKLGN